MSVADRAKKAAAEPAEESEDTVVVTARPETDESDRKRHAGNFEATRLALMRQKKVSVRCFKDEVVQINGYTFQIKGGERVDVPEQVAEILWDAGRA